MQDEPSPSQAIEPAAAASGIYAPPYHPEIIAIKPGPLKMWYLREDEIGKLSSSAFGAISLALCTLLIGLCAGFVIVLQTVDPLSDRKHAEFLSLAYASGVLAVLAGAFAVIDLVRVEAAKREIRGRGITR